MNKHQFTPVTLRIILFIILLLLLAGGIAIFMLGYDKLKTFASEAQQTSTQAQTSRSSVQNLIATKSLLEQEAKTVKRADQLVAQSKSYLYQDQIINDITKYANESSLSVVNISFTDAKTTSVATPAPAAGAVASPTATSGAPAGVKSMTANVTLKNPTNYDAILKFIHRIEQSLFRMQVSQIGLSRSSDGKNADQVSSDILTIEVYVR